MVGEFRFSHRLKVRYSEIDGQKIVFNAHYLTYLDIAATEYFEEGLNLDLHQLVEEGAFDFVLAKTTLEYKGSARLGDWLNIWCRVDRIGNSSYTKKFMITRDKEEEPLILADIIYVCIDPKSHQSQPVPDFIRESIKEYEGKEF